MRPTIQDFEKMLRCGRDMFFRATQNAQPHDPLNGEEVCILCEIATAIGLGSNYFTIRVVAEFCTVTNPVGDLIFTDMKYEELFPPDPEIETRDTQLAVAA